MARYLLLAVLAFAAVSVATGGILSVGTVQNKFQATFNLIPDPFHQFSFFHMPRDQDDAQHSSWKQHYIMHDGYITVWCRKNDYRVCVLFDARGSVAGMRLSVTAKDMLNTSLPVDPAYLPEWERWTSNEFGELYSTTVFFQSKEQIEAGGRSIDKATLTIPDGLWILQTDAEGNEYYRLHVPMDESKATEAGFTEQSCFMGMGKHYFQELTPETDCEAHRPYFMLYGPKTKKLNGFGITMFGKPSEERGWYEHPTAAVAKLIAPNSPQCLGDFIDTYGFFTIHVYFVDKPWYTFC